MNSLKKWFLEQVRSLLLVILVGTLGGNLLNLVTGGFRLTETAHASSTSLETPGTQAVVSNVHYSIDPARPDRLLSVEFSARLIDGSAPTGVKVQLQSEDGEWFSCLQTGGEFDWNCPLRGVGVRAADQIQVWAE